MNQTGTQPINLLLVDDHAMFREGIMRLFEKEDDIQIVGQCGSAQEALSVLKKSGATMVLLDVDLGQERALDFVVEARRTGFDGQVLVVTAGVTGQEAIQLVQSGVAGILHKQNTGDMLRDAVRKVSLGGVCLENDYLSPLFKTLDRTRQSSKPKLTDREKQMLRFIFQGFTNKEIGSELDISEGAVKAALHVVFDKLGARTRAQLVKIALEQYKEEL